MASTVVGNKTQQLIYALCLPLAVLLGYILAEPLEPGNAMVVIMVLTCLCLPFFIRWYHGILVASWNLAVNPFFFPGRPYLWMVVATVGIVVALVNRSTNAQKRFLPSGGVSWSLALFGMIVLATALATGGFGVRTLGSESYGGRAYFYIWAAIVGFFVLISERIPTERAGVYAGLFFLSGLSGVASHLAFLAGPKADFLLEVFPPEFSLAQAGAQDPGSLGVAQAIGLVGTSLALFCWALARYGIRGICEWTKPWRLLLVVGAFVGGLMSGYRSFVVLFGLVFLAMFFLEGLYRTKWLFGLGGAAALATAAMLFLVPKLPLQAQRALSFLPLDVQPAALQSAIGSSQWRIEMWESLLPEVPKYLFKGKGYRLDPTELYMASESAYRGFASSSYTAMVAGDYHNGPLSVLIPFGIWGAIGFGWVLLATGRLLHHNYRHGPPVLQKVNTLLFALFVARLVFFLVCFGALYSDFFIFTGLAGLSVSLNGGMSRAPEPEVRTELLQAEVA
jgi:hypothetical protein